MVASGKNCYFRRASYANLTLLHGSLFLTPTLPTFSLQSNLSFIFQIPRFLTENVFLKTFSL